MARHEVKKKVEKIKQISKKREEGESKSGIVWRKNKNVLSP